MYGRYRIVKYCYCILHFLPRRLIRVDSCQRHDVRCRYINYGSYHYNNNLVILFLIRALQFGQTSAAGILIPKQRVLDFRDK